jgi:antirestriction protein ArdC
MRDHLPFRLRELFFFRREEHEVAVERERIELDGDSIARHVPGRAELRHAGYISNWLELLKSDERAIFTAASKASQAADYLRAFSETVENAQELVPA